MLRVTVNPDQHSLSCPFSEATRLIQTMCETDEPMDRVNRTKP